MLEFFCNDNKRHNYNTRRRNDPTIIARKSAVLNDSFLCRAPFLWSNLNINIKNLCSFTSFKKKIKKEKLKIY